VGVGGGFSVDGEESGESVMVIVVVDVD